MTRASEEKSSGAFSMLRECFIFAEQITKMKPYTYIQEVHVYDTGSNKSAGCRKQ